MHPGKKTEAKRSGVPCSAGNRRRLLHIHSRSAQSSLKKISFSCHTFPVSVFTIVEERDEGHHIVRVMRFARRGRRQAQNPSFMCGGACRRLSALTFSLFHTAACRAIKNSPYPQKGHGLYHFSVLSQAPLSFYRKSSQRVASPKKRNRAKQRADAAFCRSPARIVLIIGGNSRRYAPASSPRRCAI